VRRVLVSATISILIWLSYLAVAYAYGAARGADVEESFTVATLYVVLVTAALVPLAHPGESRRWWHWIVWPGLALAFGIIPIVVLPWRIVSAHARGTPRPAY
jgi:hypothetical protein